MWCKLLAMVLLCSAVGRRDLAYQFDVMQLHEVENPVTGHMWYTLVLWDWVEEDGSYRVVTSFASVYKEKLEPEAELGGRWRFEYARDCAVESPQLLRTRSKWDVAYWDSMRQPSRRVQLARRGWWVDWWQ